MMLEPDKDLRRVLGEDQIDATDDTIEDVLSGAYDDAQEYMEEFSEDDEIETVMDAEEDMEDENEDIPDREAELARLIMQECQGLDDGAPKTTIGLMLEEIDSGAGTNRILTKTAFYNPELKVCTRQGFVELRFTYKSATDKDLRVMWAHLEKYGELYDAIRENSVKVPLLTIAMVPLKALGTCFMTAVNPIMWVLQPSRPGEECNQVRVLLNADDLSFFETSEVSLEEVSAEAQRDAAARREAYAQALDDDRKAEEAIERSNAILEDLRKNV